MEDKIKDLVAKLDALDESDPEVAHGDADDALLDALRMLGGGEVADAWERAYSRVGFWYA